MRRLAAPPLLVALTAAGCLPNPYYQAPPEGSASDAATTTTTTLGGSSTSEATTTAATTTTTSTTGETTDGATGSTSIATTAQSGTESESDSDSDSDSSTTDGSCDAMQTLTFKGGDQVEDAFFLVNAIPDEVCYLDEVSFMGAPCGSLNAGGLTSMRLQRQGSGEEVMFAMRFDFLTAYEDVLVQGHQILGGKISAVFYDLSNDVDLEVGLIAGDQTWKAGDGYGAPPIMDEATFDERVSGPNVQYWKNGDGPRGASTKICDFHVDAGDYGNHPTWTVCDLDPQDVAALSVSQGVVLYFPKGVEALYGPGIKATLSDPKYEPFLEIYYCVR